MGVSVYRGLEVVADDVFDNAQYVAVANRGRIVSFGLK